MNASDRAAVEKAIQDIISLAPHTEITNHTPGRVQLKLFFSGMKLITSIDFKSMGDAIAGIRDVQVKTLSRSAVIDYDPEAIPPDIWEDLDRIKKDPDSAAQVTQRLNALLGVGNHP
jgi:hypothetical protein